MKPYSAIFFVLILAATGCGRGVGDPVVFAEERLVGVNMSEAVRRLESYGGTDVSGAISSIETDVTGRTVPLKWIELRDGTGMCLRPNAADGTVAAVVIGERGTGLGKMVWYERARTVVTKGPRPHRVLTD